MKTDKQSIVRTGFKEAKNRFVIVSLPLSFFAILAIAVLVLAFFAPITLFLTVPFIIIPSFFAIAAINTIAVNKNTHEGLGFFVMFRAYFSQIFRGGYKVIFGFLKSLLVYVVVSVILTAILTSTVLAKDLGYISFMNEIEAMTDANLITDALNRFMETNATFNNLIVITSLVSSFCSFLMFIHHLSVNSIKYNYNFVSKLPLPMQDLNLIFKVVLKQNRGRFYKLYYKAFWFLLLLLIVGYGGGAAIAYFFLPNINMGQIPVIGLFGAFVILMFFIPYFINASMFIFNEFRSNYIDTLIDLSKKSLEEMKKAQAISEEKEKEILNVIESQKNVEKNIEDKVDKE